MAPILNSKHVIVITGTIGGGKSMAAASLAAHLRVHGLKTAFMDIDDIYRMSRQDDKWNDPDIWIASRRVCGGVAEAFYQSNCGSSVLSNLYFCRASRSTSTPRPDLRREKTSVAEIGLSGYRVGHHPRCGRAIRFEMGITSVYKEDRKTTPRKPPTLIRASRMGFFVSPCVLAAVFPLPVTPSRSSVRIPNIRR